MHKKLPQDRTLQIVDQMLTAYLKHIGDVDAVLFHRFDEQRVSSLQARLQNGADALSHEDWDGLSQLLRSITLSLRPFPELARDYPAGTLYKAADEVAAYALTLPGEPPSRATPPRGKRYGF